MRRRHRRPENDADLDITAFMNLMIVLVPILLINMIFAHTSVLELNFPDASSEVVLDSDELQLEVLIRPSNLLVSDGKGNVIKEIQNLGSEPHKGYDFSLLSRVMQELKVRYPEKKDIVLLAQKQTDYQTLVTAMDSVRSFKTDIAGNLVDAELFPEISIADAPEEDA